MPPFIPKISSDQSITKYFEDEKDILGSETESATSIEFSDLGRIDVPSEVAAVLPYLFSNGTTGTDSDVAKAEAVRWLEANNRRILKALGKEPKKRARDKILRDPKMYKTAMHVRKRYAFMGYTYRRPHYIKKGNPTLRATSVLSSASFRSTGERV
jgi:protein-serine/threonine kinase